MKISMARWIVSLPASMFYCTTASALHGMLPFRSGMAEVAGVLAYYLMHSSVALWVQADLRRRRKSMPYDFGSFVFCTWPVFVPIYLFSTRGWRALVPIVCFIALCVAAVIAGKIPSLLSAP